MPLPYARCVMPNSDSEELRAELLSLFDKQLDVLELCGYETLTDEEQREALRVAVPSTAALKFSMYSRSWRIRSAARFRSCGLVEGRDHRRPIQAYSLVVA